MTCDHERKERCLFYGGEWRLVCLLCSEVLPVVPVQIAQAPRRATIATLDA